MEKGYKKNINIAIAWLVGMLIVISILIFGKWGQYTILDIICILGGVCWFIIGFPLMLSYGIRIDETGISNLYLLGSRIFKVRQHIKWEDVKGVAVAARWTIAVVPKLPPDRLKYRYKNFIIIPYIIKNRKELLREIIANAKNANVEESVRLLAK